MVKAMSVLHPALDKKHEIVLRRLKQDQFLHYLRDN